MNSRNGMRPVHPGEILREELDTLGLSANAFVEGTGRTGEPDHNDRKRTTGASARTRRCGWQDTSGRRRNCG